MIGVHIRAALTRAARHPVTFLLAINVACAALGLVQFAYVLAVLKPEDFAPIGVLAAITGVTIGLIDVQLGDLTSRFYFSTPKEDSATRGRLLAASLFLHLAAGLIVGALGFVAAWLIAPTFVEQGLAGWWSAAMALRMATGHPVNVLTNFVRMLGAFGPSGWLRLAMQAIVTVTTVVALQLSPGLNGYFGGVAFMAVASFVVVLVATERLVRAHLGSSLIALPSRDTLATFLHSKRFLVGGSLLGWSKLLSRSGDTLIVAALAGDTVTGTYRVARQAFDNLGILTDAIHQYYTPTIVDAASQNRSEEVSRHRQRVMVIGAAAAAGVIFISRFVLEPLAAARYPHYLPALPAFEVMAGLLVVTLGVHGWLWPLLVARGGVAFFGVAAIAGAMLQLASIAWLSRAGLLDATTAAATGWIMAAIGYGLPLFLWARVARN